MKGLSGTKPLLPLLCPTPLPSPGKGAKVGMQDEQGRGRHFPVLHHPGAKHFHVSRGVQAVTCNTLAM